MKKIIFVIESLYGGGAERVTAALASSIAQIEEYEVVILTYQRTRKDYNVLDPVKISVLENGNGGRFIRLFNRTKELLSEIKMENPNYVVSLAMPKTQILLSFVSIFREYKLFLSERNDPLRYPKNIVLKCLRNWAYKNCDGVIFQTEEAKSYFGESIQRKSTVICNPITQKLPERYTGVREKRIVNFCRLDKQKNLLLLINAFAQIVQEFPLYILEIYGNGPQLAVLKEYVDFLKLERKIIFYDFAPDIHERVLKSALFVSSSDYEGISNSMLEAMSIGLPVICTDCPAGGARMIIDDGKNGVLTPVGDVNKMVDAMRMLLSDEEKMESLSIEAAKLKDKLNVSKIACKWLDYMNTQ